jgi:hypothetical protein
MTKTANNKRRDMKSNPSGDSIGDSSITMSEWLGAIGSGGRPPVNRAEENDAAPADLRAMAARVLRSVAASTDAGHYDKAARLLRELRATDEHLRRHGEYKARRPFIPPSRCSMTSDVDEWLEKFLTNEEKPATEVFKAGKYSGCSEDQLQRARKRIGAVLRRAGMPSRSYWRLEGVPPGDDLYANALKHPDDRGVFNPDHLAIDRWLRDFLKKGPKASEEVYRRGCAAGFSERELRNARQRIGALIHQRGYPCRTTWLLRGHQGDAK